MEPEGAGRDHVRAVLVEGESVAAEKESKSHASQSAPPKLSSVHHAALVSEAMFGLVIACAVVALLTFGVVVFGLSDSLRRGGGGIELIDVIIFVVVSALGTGFGDTVVDPTSSGMKVVVILYIWLSAFIFTFVVGLWVSRAARLRRLEGASQRETLAISVAVVVAVVQVGSFAFSRVEGWTFTDSLYFATVAICSVGYGDMVPVTRLGKFALLVYLLAGLAATTFAMSTMVDTIAVYFLQSAEHRFLRQRISQRDLAAMDQDRDGAVTESEFILFILQEIGRVSPEELLDLRAAFHCQVAQSRSAGDTESSGLLLAQAQAKLFARSYSTVV
eukprot:CAMPEP_0204275742 /NCGR_PEP_ID=MMETSP0468-20130131/26604_1 /ASSEMBLY_ACC=CAM_ASM_000383 /TAXON_ID=2969 /ORGANISM="Oxyrrhis marina" /LENGTH=331 /DNA_ID=CAMNT_0051252159 /DNA_START=41 /DNA_END=1036 /DNA_ORIENTATION=-